jgi:hypothetical protein
MIKLNLGSLARRSGNRLRRSLAELRRWAGTHPRRAFVLSLAIAFFGASVSGYVITVRNQNAKKTASLPAPPEGLTVDFTDPAQVYQLKLPASWVIQNNIAKPADVEELVALAPKTRIDDYIKAHGNDFLVHSTVHLYRSDEDPKTWFGKLGLAPPVASNEPSVNGYKAYWARIVMPDYAENHYVIVNKGVLLHFTFHERTKLVSSGINEDFHDDLITFDRIFTSIKFIN